MCGRVTAHVVNPVKGTTQYTWGFHDVGHPYTTAPYPLSTWVRRASLPLEIEGTDKHAEKRVVIGRYGIDDILMCCKLLLL